MNKDRFTHWLISGDFLIFRLCENQRSAQCFLCEHRPLTILFNLGYGMTELSGASHCTPFEGETKSGSVGLLLSNLECKVSAPVSIDQVLQPSRKRHICNS